MNPKGQQRRCEGSTHKSEALVCPEGVREHWPEKVKASIQPGSRNGLGAWTNSKSVRLYMCECEGAAKKA